MLPSRQVHELHYSYAWPQHTNCSKQDHLRCPARFIANSITLTLRCCCCFCRLQMSTQHINVAVTKGNSRLAADRTTLNATSRVTTADDALVVPYAQQVPDLRLPQILSDEYVKAGEALHVALSRPIVAYRKNRNLGSLLVKASH
jgi:hypothetical protein